MFLHTYTGSDGQSHPMDYDAPPIGKIELEERDPISIMMFPAGTFIDWHTSERLYMVTLSGEAEIGYGDGQTRRLKPGDIHFEDDVTGQGHTFRVIGDKPRVTLMIPVK